MENKYTLYGDGINDDTAAIQEMIDSGVCEVSLPAPKKCYLISKPLVIPSNFKLKLPRFAEIKLADHSDCFMLQTKTVKKPSKRLLECFNEKQKLFWYFVDELSPDPEDACHDFEIEGGIWNYNNKNQKENPILTSNFTEEHYLGHLMFFYNVRNFRLSNMTFKDPANYAVMMDRASYFTVENITFDFNDGNPCACNMDGIHLDGNCHYGVIRNLQGACYDDLVALNAHEGSAGDITNIEIDGIFAENCHSAVRLLNVIHKVEHISISNVYGTYYQYCIGFTKYYPGETTGYFDAITLDNIHASKAPRLPIQEVHMGDKNHHFPLVWLQSGTHIKNLSITDLHRRECVNPIETIHIGSTAEVDTLNVSNCSSENQTGKPMPFILKNSPVKNLSVTNVYTDGDEIIKE
jgi:hypothetical protein